MLIRRRIKWTLFAAQSFGSAGFLISSTVTPLVGASLSGHAAWAGVPAAFYWSGGAAFALLWGRLMDVIGRRRTLVLGLVTGVIGAAGAAAGLAAGTFAGFVGALVLMGAANTAIQQARFVAAEVHPAAERGRAISTVVLGGTIGGVLGPVLVGPTSVVAERSGSPGLAGPYIASLVFFAIGAVVVWAFLRPEPRDVALALARETPGPDQPLVSRPIAELLRDPGVRAAMGSMVLAQGTMSMLMVISSLHMKAHDHALSGIALVMSSHVTGMYAFSIVSGRLADTWGRGPLIAAGGALLIVAGLGAGQAVSLLPMSAVLLVLGLGWNLCYVGGSALLSDRLTQPERARVQGINDALLTSASALGSLVSGVAFATVGYAAIGQAAVIVSLIPLSLGWRMARRIPSPVGVGSAGA